MTGTLVEFDFKSELLVASVDGFVSGRNHKGFFIYPGIGNGAKCGNQNPAPAQITIHPSMDSSYTLISCSEPIYDSNKPSYYKQHPDLKWIPTTAPKASKVKGAIRVKNKAGTFYIGRLSYKIDGQTYYLIGKIKGTNFLYQEPRNIFKQKAFLGKIDVLACQTLAPAPEPASAPAPAPEPNPAPPPAISPSDL